MAEDMVYKVESIGMRKKTIEVFLNEQYEAGWELVSIDWAGGMAVFKNRNVH